MIPMPVNKSSSGRKFAATFFFYNSHERRMADSRRALVKLHLSQLDWISSQKISQRLASCIFHYEVDKCLIAMRTGCIIRRKQNETEVQWKRRASEQKCICSNSQKILYNDESGANEKKNGGEYKRTGFILCAMLRALSVFLSIHQNLLMLHHIL